MHDLGEGVTVRGVLGAVLDHADRAPDRPAVKDLDRALTRGELSAAAGRVAAGLLEKGVQPGDRVALLIGNSVDFVVADWAVYGRGSRLFRWRSPIQISAVRRSWLTAGPHR